MSLDAKSQALLQGDRTFRRGAVVFTHDNDLGDLIIRVASRAYWSHVSIALGDGRAICAWAASGRVIATYPDLPQVPDVQARALPANVNGERLIRDLSAQIAKPYDWLGLAAVPFPFLARRLPGGPPGAFFCSALVAWGLAQQGAWTRNPRTTSPQALFDALA